MSATWTERDGEHRAEVTGRTVCLSFEERADRLRHAEITVFSARGAEIARAYLYDDGTLSLASAKATAEALAVHA